MRNVRRSLFNFLLVILSLGLFFAAIVPSTTTSTLAQTPPPQDTAELESGELDTENPEDENTEMVIPEADEQSLDDEEMRRIDEILGGELPYESGLNARSDDKGKIGNPEEAFRSSDNRLVIEDDQFGNKYYAAEEIVVNGDVDGDLVAAAARIIINGDVYGNLIVGAGAVEVNGNVYSDTLLAAGVIIVNGELGDSRLFAGDVYVNSNRIEGDLVIGAVNAYVSDATRVSGYNQVAASETRLNELNNPTRISEVQSMYDFSTTTSTDQTESFLGLAILGSIFALIISLLIYLGSILLGYLVIKYFPVFSEKTIRTMKTDTIKSFLTGLLVNIAAPFVALILIVSVIGLPILGFLILLAILANALAQIYFNYLAGELILNLLRIKTENKFLIITTGFVAIGLIFFVVGLLAGIPFAGILFGFISFFLSLLISSLAIGAIVRNKFNARKASV